MYNLMENLLIYIYLLCILNSSHKYHGCITDNMRARIAMDHFVYLDAPELKCFVRIWKQLWLSWSYPNPDYMQKVWTKLEWCKLEIASNDRLSTWEMIRPANNEQDSFLCSTSWTWLLDIHKFWLFFFWWS